MTEAEDVQADLDDEILGAIDALTDEAVALRGDVRRMGRRTWFVFGIAGLLVLGALEARRHDVNQCHIARDNRLATREVYVGVYDFVDALGRDASPATRELLLREAARFRDGGLNDLKIPTCRYLPWS